MVVLPSGEDQVDINHLVEEIQACEDLSLLEAKRVSLLGRQGLITTLLKSLGSMSPEQRAEKGNAFNDYKRLLAQAISDKQHALTLQQESVALMAEACDVSLPGRQWQSHGHMHPVMRTQMRLEDLFEKMGFSVLSGEVSQEVESEYYNFSALNIPKSHPARAMHDTFYLENGQLLRTHTSPVQIRAMQADTPRPLRIVTPGKVFRCDSDQTHTPMFHQMEGLVIDESCHFGHLKGLIQSVLSAFFEKPVALRFRPSYFPFTEPSAEVDIQWPIDGGADAKWLEVLGCGMVHQNVLTECGYDVERYQGFAFGFGLDRLTMLQYGVDDLRSFFAGDLSFLEQF